MAKRDDIHKVLIIGSGPIVIGQACEFDYSGTQACKALRACGYQIVLVNSNPATIMTDPVMADATYIEPLNVARLEQIIAKERPDALLPNLGGQTGLNLSLELAKKGILEKYGVEVIGVNLEAIERGEDREIFKETMRSLGIGLPDSRIIHTVEEAKDAAAELGYPVVVRPAYTMGGAGGGLVYNIDELRTIVARGLALSLTTQCLIEQSILGWEELEVEVVRDAAGKMVTVCFIENVDAVGVHTGDSFCTAPMLTISPEVQKQLQDIAFRVVESIGVIGGTNVQLARDPESGRIVIIEINPRTSRSSALASKATGFPIALISAQLASGLHLADIPYWRDGTLDRYTPSGDYVVVKFARWAFEKFKGAEDRLGTQMKAVGEVMSIGKTYKEAFQKAIRSLENGRSGLGFARDFNTLAKDELLARLRFATSERHYLMYEALRKGATVVELHALTHVKAWFIEQMQELVQLEEKLLAFRGRPAAGLPDDLLRQAKLDGFADKYLAKILAVPEAGIRQKRTALGITEGWEAVPVSGVKDAAYYYSTYHAKDSGTASANPKKVMILGGGPNRIGQGIEFDYCCCHAAMALRAAGYETIMVNCNPETVSTDYDTSDKLYFEPLTVEDVLQIHAKEKPAGVIVQFGGQTPLNIARELSDNGVRILGTSIDTIDTAEDRDLFRQMMERLEIPMPESGMASTIDEAVAIAGRIGYPIMIRPSFILGGRGMEIIYDEDMLREYVARAIDVSPERPLLLDRFLQSALECEADALADGKDVFIPAVMEHIELAGVHSGDSACVIPPVSIPQKHLATINTYTRKIAQELKVVGLMNMQYAIENDKVYVLEANPRASRTVPLVSKVCNVQMARIATQLMLGATIPEMKLSHKTIPHYGVKESVFPFDKFPEVDPVLGPEMRSTGEVLGMSSDFGLAFCKSQEAVQNPLPTAGTVLISVWERTPQVLEIARTFAHCGFRLRATTGTRGFLAENGIAADLAIKINEGRPDIADDIRNGLVQFVVNTPISKRASQVDDSYIRKAAIKYKVPYMTTLAAAAASARGIAVLCKGAESALRSLQEYHAAIR
ncbi:carbamoyl phosphate synthase large subunit [Opitutaceae bacterium TAV5]|nr:carbamoyl phosphate synthase large subunit [Opitutaceae bacterium TAV5]